MLVLLPLTAIILSLVCMIVLGCTVRRACIMSAVLYGLTVALSTELFSLFALIDKTSIVALWAGAVISLAICLFRLLKRTSFALPPLPKLSFLLYACIGAIAAIMVLTLLDALISPPNNWDSMAYHMGRVMHWIQDRSVAHYPTNITRQLYNPPWAEYAIMHLELLSGGDRFADLVQWSSMVGSMIGVTLIAQELGASTRAQIMSAVVAATIPMGILQSTSTQNDYVVSFWLICFVYFGIRYKTRPDLYNALWLGSSLALAILTKGTAYIYALPFVIWFAASAISGARNCTVSFTRHAVIVMMVVLGLNAGHYVRNYKVWGSPITTDSEHLTNETHDPSLLLSTVIRNFALHVGTPSESVNDLSYRAVVEVHKLLNMDVNSDKITAPDIRFEINSRIHEDLAGNPLHMLLIIVSLIMFAARSELRKNSLTIYMGAVIGGFLFSCYLLKWNPFGSRTQLPLFLLWAPAIAVILNSTASFANVCVSILIVASAPYLLYDETRPLLTSRHESIFLSDRTSQYFVSRSKGYMDAYIDTAKRIKSSGCRNVGIVSEWEGWEYPFWVLMKEEGGPMPRIEHIDVHNNSATLANDFNPCAMVMIR